MTEYDYVIEDHEKQEEEGFIEMIKLQNKGDEASNG